MCQGTRVGHEKLLTSVFPTALFLMSPDYIGPPVRVLQVATKKQVEKAYAIAASGKKGEMGPVCDAGEGELGNGHRCRTLYVQSYRHRKQSLTDKIVETCVSLRDGKFGTTTIHNPSARIRKDPKACQEHMQLHSVAKVGANNVCVHT